MGTPVLRTVPLSYSLIPSAHTWNTIDGLPPTSLSMPTSAVNAEQAPPKSSAISLRAWAPIPFGYVLLPIARVRPSPAAASPLLVFLSAGPHPLVGLSHGRSLTCDVPTGGEAAKALTEIASGKMAINCII